MAVLLAAGCCALPRMARASDFDADIWDALKVVNEKAGQTGMMEDDRKKYNELLTKYGEDRARLMQEMLALLSKQELSGLRDEWSKRNESGKGLLENLEKAVPKVGDKEGLAAAGLKDFAAGEKKIWELNGKADTAIMGEIIVKVYYLDLAVLKKADEDLKGCLEKDKSIEAQLARCENDLRADAKEIVKELALKAAAKQFGDLADETNASDALEGVFERMAKNLLENQKSAKDKHEVLGVLQQNIDVIEKAREQMSPEWIEEICKKGESAAKALADAGATGDYKAADWKKFGELATKALQEQRTRSIEQSKKVFNELLPTFREEVKKKFATFMDDPDKLASWQKEMDESYKTMDELVTKREELAKALAEGPFKAGIKASLSDLKNTIKLSWALFRSSNKENEDLMKK
jgi:hypothetical protein